MRLTKIVNKYLSEEKIPFKLSDKNIISDNDIKKLDKLLKQKKSIAKMFNHDFTNSQFLIYDKNKRTVYYEDDDGFWTKYRYDKKR